MINATFETKRDEARLVYTRAVVDGVVSKWWPGASATAQNIARKDAVGRLRMRNQGEDPADWKVGEPLAVEYESKQVPDEDEDAPPVTMIRAVVDGTASEWFVGAGDEIMANAAADAHSRIRKANLDGAAPGALEGRIEPEEPDAEDAADAGQ